MLVVILNYAHFARESLPDDHPARESMTEVAAAAGRAATLTRKLSVEQADAHRLGDRGCAV